VLGEFFGTPAYTSPEQARGDVEALSPFAARMLALAEPLVLGCPTRDDGEVSRATGSTGRGASVAERR